MLLVSEFWQRRRHFFLSILSNFLALFLLLSVSSLSSLLEKGLERQLTSLSLEVSCLQFLSSETDAETISHDLVERYGITRFSEFWLRHEDSFDLAFCRDLSGLFKIKLYCGHFFTDQQVINNENVAVLGHEIWKMLGSPAPGEVISLDGALFEVSGVLDPEWENLYFSGDEMIFLPIGYRQDPQESRLYFICERPYYADYLDEAVGQGNYLLIRQKMLKSSFSQIIRQGRIILVLLSGFALIISLLGMMNHTLSSLQGRYREIGIKKALGASEQDIIRQFLLEGFLIMVISSLAALLANEMIMKTVSLLGSLEPQTDRHEYAVLLWVIPAGCLFCLYPAYKAGKVSIAQAIRN